MLQIKKKKIYLWKLNDVSSLLVSDVNETSFVSAKQFVTYLSDHFNSQCLGGKKPKTSNCLMCYITVCPGTP